MMKRIILMFGLIMTLAGLTSCSKDQDRFSTDLANTSWIAYKAEIKYSDRPDETIEGKENCAKVSISDFGITSSYIHFGNEMLAMGSSQDMTFIHSFAYAYDKKSNILSLLWQNSTPIRVVSHTSSSLVLSRSGNGYHNSYTYTETYYFERY